MIKTLYRHNWSFKFKSTFCTKFKGPLRDLNRDKISKSKFLKAEMVQNPEFFKAFPHLKPKAKEIYEREYNEDFDSFLGDRETVVPKDFSSDVPDTVYDGYFNSLLHHRDGLISNKSEKDNELEYVQGFSDTQKPKKWMTQEEKDTVHHEVDIQMQQLEDSGLTRMEILFNEQKGLPLADDPVFQYLKNNRVAREMLGKEFIKLNI